MGGVKAGPIQHSYIQEQGQYWYPELLWEYFIQDFDLQLINTHHVEIEVHNYQDYKMTLLAIYLASNFNNHEF